MRQLGQFCIALLVFINVAYADTTLTERPAVKQFINNMVKAHGFDKKQLTAVLNQARFQPKIIESMEKPYEKKSWDQYKGLFLTPQRLQEGIAYWQANQKTLAKAEAKFGVPAHIIVATIGVETLYGKHQGNYRVLDALTTLAFNYPKRAAFFTKELKEYLLLCREQGVPATTYMGSYAGAIGKPQFMPSSYRFYAVDFTGNGKRDLVNEDRDVIASVANYYHKHGWKMNELVAQPAKVSGGKYKTINTNARHADYDFHQVIAAGVKPLAAKAAHPMKAGLIELNTQKGEEYWLAYPNFYVITRYNTSPQYALVVYLLSQQLHNQWGLAQAAKLHAYA